MMGENRELVTNELLEVQDYWKITDHFRGIYRIYPNIIKENRRISTCNRLDLQTLGSQLIMLKNLPDHCIEREPNKLLAIANGPCGMVSATFKIVHVSSCYGLW